MVSIVKTFAFSGIDVIDVDVEVKLSSGLPAFNIVGLGDKAISESKERIRAAISSIGLSLPSKRIVVNLSPADLVKEGSHYDLPIAVGILAQMDVFDNSAIEDFYILGELSLNSKINRVNGILPATMKANQNGCGVIIPNECANEASYAGDNVSIVAPSNLLSLMNHLRGNQTLPNAKSKPIKHANKYEDLKDVKGQETAKRALEIAAAGGHNMLMIGPPGTGKSMLAKRIMGILPDPTIKETLEINVIASISGEIKDDSLTTAIPFREPHHSCSMPAMVGGGSKVKVGEVTLAHNGVLFLDELPEFPPAVLDALRQPMESNKILISRVSDHITFPSKFQLIAAMNPCKCGYFGTKSKECNKTPFCATNYQGKISGPILDRIDIFTHVNQVNIFDKSLTSEKLESSSVIKKRVENAREIQKNRYNQYETDSNIQINAKIPSNILEKFCEIDIESEEILRKSIDKNHISIRGVNSILRVARTIADLASRDKISKSDILEAMSYKNNMV